MPNGLQLQTWGMLWGEGCWKLECGRSLRGTGHEFVHLQAAGRVTRALAGGGRYSSLGSAGDRANLRAAGIGRGSRQLSPSRTQARHNRILLIV